MNWQGVDGYERALVASVLWPASGDALGVVDRLRGLGVWWDDFGLEVGRWVMRAAFALGESGGLEVPASDVLGWLQGNEPEAVERLGAGGLVREFPPDLALPGLELLESPARRVMEMGAARRDAVMAMGWVRGWEDGGQTAEWFRGLVEGGLAERERRMGGTGRGPRGMDEVGRESVEWLGERARGGLPAGVVPWGFSMVDRMFGGGMCPGELYVIAARPSVGKSALAVSVLRHGAGVHGAAGLLFSLEMPARDVHLRLVAQEGGVDLRALRSGALCEGDWVRARDAMGRVNGWDVGIDDEGGVELGELLCRARWWCRRRAGMRRVVMVDYAQLVRVDLGRQGTREQEVARVSAGLKGLAKREGVPVVLLAQLNREADKGGRPRLGQLRESGAMEQDADGVILLHRDKEDGEKPCEGIVAKNRNGPTGTVRLEFVAGTTEFREVRRVADEDVPVPEVDRNAGKRAPAWMGRGGKGRSDDAGF